MAAGDPAWPGRHWDALLPSALPVGLVLTGDSLGYTGQGVFSLNIIPSMLSTKSASFLSVSSGPRLLGLQTFTVMFFPFCLAGPSPSLTKLSKMLKNGLQTQGVGGGGEGGRAGGGGASGSWARAGQILQGLDFLRVSSPRCRSN